MKPKVRTKCVANHYAPDNETIIEFTNGSRAKMKGGLISFRNQPDGTLMISVYALDHGILMQMDPERRSEG